WDLFQKEMPDRFSNDYLWIANPPRAGLGKLVMNKVSKIKPKQFIYSSCNYNTLVRDLIIFSKIGYKITFLEIFDFFPRTPYFETLVKLEFD
ncbi:MAG: class I SAM-dependent RNA methyltransferase, partial [Leptospiraceae bacterium]|nr:class I SAM-dependent RNA methyltransferase [Leptospiraceae bacterium]